MAKDSRSKKGDINDLGAAHDANQLIKEKYTTERVVGNGTFGVVYEAFSKVDGRKVAIKKVLQDRRYKNRELQIVQLLKHPNVIEMLDCFFENGTGKHRRDVYLNLVMEYVPENLYQTIRTHVRAKQTIPFLHTKVYAYQICRAVGYINRLGVCHRDIKPQNILLDPSTHVVKACDFGSAKVLVEGEKNTAYICSRYYRAPELIFETTSYTTMIDVWSVGCVIAEIFLGEPLFQGGTSLDQLVQIIQVLGSPSKEDILAMNYNYTTFRFPHVKPLEWNVVFQHIKCNGEPIPAEALELISQMLIFNPNKRVTMMGALAHPFFDDVREEGVTCHNGKPMPPLFNFDKEELAEIEALGLLDKIVPARFRKAKETAGSKDTAGSQDDDEEEEVKTDSAE